AWGDDAQWDAMLDGRRFAWAAFHKLDDRYVEMVNNIPLGEDPWHAIAEPRPLTMYYVTLTRGRSTRRYARQNPDFVPDPLARDVPQSDIAPLPPEDDVLFPVPWRVQVLLPDDLASGDGTGVPTDVQAGKTVGDDAPAATNGLVARLFARGGRFIDEINGRVYTVEKYRLSADGDLATMTLDTEILFDDVNDGAVGGGNDTLELEERLRTVWVFPPRVDRSTGAPVFAGRQPVVGIDVRTLRIFPSRAAARPSAAVRGASVGAPDRTPKRHVPRHWSPKRKRAGSPVRRAHR
ncbi:MAG: hypothetical protein ACE5E6_12525, partial [Phycisphaerae bacterium]